MIWNARPATSRAPSGSFVSAIGSAAITRGSDRPASLAAAAMVGTVWEASVLRPVIQVAVPSASVPATFSMRGPSAATTTGTCAAPATWSPAFTRKSSPWKETGRPWTRGIRTSRYSRICRAGFP